MKTLFLLRHCVTSDSEKGINGGQTDTPLSETGRQCARGLVVKLAKEIYDVVYISPLQRTKQTIEPYLLTLSHKPLVVVEPLTIERSLGVLTNSVSGDGQIPASIQASGLSKTEWRPEGGESTLDVSIRAQQFLDYIKNTTGKNLLICSHQNFLRCLELKLMNLPVNDDTFFSASHPKISPGKIRVYQLITT